MKGIKDFLLFLFFFVISILFYQDSVENNYIQMNGELKTVKVLNLNGARLCIATIEYLNKVYRVEIAKIDCFENRVMIGQSIELRYMKSLDKFIIPTLKTQLIYFMSLVFFVVPLYFLLKMIKRGFS